MKQWIIIIVALSLIIGFNCWQTKFLENTSRYVLTDINEIKIATLRNDETAMKEAVKGLTETWESVKIGWDTFAEHDSVEGIEESITKIKAHVELGNIKEVIVENDVLKEKIERIVDMESFRIVNVF